MAPRQHGQISSRHDQSRQSQLAALHGSEEPRRRRVDIQDLLNPDTADNVSNLPDPSHSHHHSREHQPRQWSRHSSCDSDLHALYESRSLRSSPGGHRSPPRGRTSREFRPTYSDEEIHFIWYCRDDLQWEWRAVRDAFRKEFPNKQRRAVGGIQCKYYRHLEGEGIPQLRQRNRKVSAVEEYGMRANTGLWYEWMARLRSTS
ncbi:MAG: hypothetical protein Q9228_000332 [Teloschistes exilis]